MKNKILHIILIMTVLMGLYPHGVARASDYHFNKGYPSNLEKLIATDAQGRSRGKQKIKVLVTGEKDPNPKVIWTQGDEEIWSATGELPSSRVTTTTHWNQGGTRGYPVSERFIDKIDATVYAPDSLEDINGNAFDRRFMDDLGVKDINYLDGPAYEPGNEKPRFTQGDKFIEINVFTGYPKPLSEEKEYGTRPDDKKKWQVAYWTPLHIDYIAHVYETKEIRVNSDNTLQEGETVQLAAEVREIDYQGNTTDWVNVSTREQTEWKTDKEGVATVNSNGVVKAEGRGTAKITALWKKGPYYIWENVTITVGEDNELPEEPVTACSQPQPGRTLEGQIMDPVVTAMIRADQRGSEPFDVLKGIPTSESIYGNVFSRDYLYEHTFVQMTGTCTYQFDVEKIWTLKWDPKKTEKDAEGNEREVPDPQEAEETVTKQYTVERPYAYWTIDTLSVYSIDEATLINYAFGSGQITLQPEGYVPPDFQAETTGDYYPPPNPVKVTAPPGTKTGGKDRPSPPDEDLQSVAEEAVPDVEVENDAFYFNGGTVMDPQRSPESGPQPGEIPDPVQIDENVLYSPYNYIPISKANKQDTISEGTIRYTLMDNSVNGGDDQEFDIYGINTVTVHTPVVNYSLVSDDQPHNQKTVPNMSRSALILERPFTVRIPTSGQHLDAGSYPGYGDRDYAKYYRIKQVRFPFDVYSADRTQFYPRNTWIDVQVPVLDTTFYLPVWVDEGDYQVEFRNIAENAPSHFSTEPEIDAQPDANTDLYYHAASDEVSVEVIGRLYDFEITDIADYNWELVFRRFKNSLAPTWITYWTGTQDIDGDKRGNKPQFTVPIRPGSHPLQGYQNVAVKTGYHFKFDFKTKGNMFGPRDGIRLTPTFDFVSKDGRTRVPVDLYYSTNQRNFIRIGSTEDQVKRFVILNDRLRQVPSEQLRDTATYKYNRYGEIHPGMMSERAYQEYYRDKFTKMKTPVGGYSLLLMPEQVANVYRSENEYSHHRQRRCTAGECSHSTMVRGIQSTCRALCGASGNKLG
jgi:hypothetical protein